MKLRDTTEDANTREAPDNSYLHFAQSSNDKFAIAVEQPKSDSFNVAVLYKEPAWDLFGVIRYWVYAERVLAETRYLELQRIFDPLEESHDLKGVLAALPPQERHWGGDEEDKSVNEARSANDEKEQSDVM
jgi:hypothetical protein